MKVIYDRGTGTLTIIFSDLPVAESDEDRPGVFLDYDPGDMSLQALTQAI